MTSRVQQTQAQLAAALELKEFQLDRAVWAGLIPPRDRARGWSFDLFQQIVATVDSASIRREVGTVPNCAASDAAQYLKLSLQACLGVDVDIAPDTIRELGRIGALPIVGHSHHAGEDWPIFDGRAIDTFADLDVLAQAARDGETLMIAQVAERLNVRRSDADHLLRAGKLVPLRWKRTGYTSKKNDPWMPLYRAGDVYALAEDPAIDWAAVRATPKGGRSPLAALPDAPKGGAS